MQWTSLLGSLSINGREDLGRQWQGRYFFRREDAGVSGEGRLQRIEEEVKIAEKKAQEGMNGKSRVGHPAVEESSEGERQATKYRKI